MQGTGKETVTRNEDCMSLEGFCKVVQMDVVQILGDNYFTKVYPMNKNNGIILHGLTILDKGVNLSPTIYLEEYYEKYSKGVSLEEVEQLIVKCFRDNKPASSVSTDFFTDWEQVKNTLIYKLINYEMNKELLENVPYVQFLDLAIVFECLIKTPFGNGTVLIHNHHFELWNKTKEEVYAVAKANTPRLMKCELIGMPEVLSDMGSELEPERLPLNESPMYVLTNQLRLHGAGCLLYEDVVADFADRSDSDLYILPSSIHEILLVKTSINDNLEEMSEMVREVNATQVSPEEILSDHVYKFTRATGKITM